MNPFSQNAEDAKLVLFKKLNFETKSTVSILNKYKILNYDENLEVIIQHILFVFSSLSELVSEIKNAEFLDFVEDSLSNSKSREEFIKSNFILEPRYSYDLKTEFLSFYNDLLYRANELIKVLKTAQVKN